MRAAFALCGFALLGCDRSPPPRPAPPTAPAPSAAPSVAPAAPVDAGPPQRPETVLLRVRVKNIDTIPLVIRTTPDLNEFVLTRRLMVSADTSDRAALYADNAHVQRVNFFRMDGLARCDQDGGVGYAGLGQPGEVTLQPGESFEVARWDGIVREEVLVPNRGVCLRETPAPPGRYRFQLDQPQLEGRPSCSWVMTHVPVIPADGGGVPDLEIRCRNARDGGAS